MPSQQLAPPNTLSHELHQAASKMKEVACAAVSSPDGSSSYDGKADAGTQTEVCLSLSSPIALECARAVFDLDPRCIHRAHGNRQQTARYRRPGTVAVQQLTILQKAKALAVAPLRKSITSALEKSAAPTVMTPMGAFSTPTSPRANSIYTSMRTRDADKFNPEVGQDESPYLDSVVPFAPSVPEETDGLGQSGEAEPERSETLALSDDAEDPEAQRVQQFLDSAG